MQGDTFTNSGKVILAFAQEWDEAKEQYIDYLESVADERATRAEKPSDLLLIFRLKGEARKIPGKI